MAKQFEKKTPAEGILIGNLQRSTDTKFSSIHFGSINRNSLIDLLNATQHNKNPYLNLRTYKTKEDPNRVVIKVLTEDRPMQGGGREESFKKSGEDFKKSAPTPKAAKTESVAVEEEWG